MSSNRAKSSWSRRRLAVYWVCVIVIFVATMALASALEVQDRGAAALLVTAGMAVFVVLFIVFAVRSLRTR